MKREYDPAQRYQTIENACRTTGLSQYYLRNGCKSGAVPHVRSGRTYMIDIPALYRRLEEKTALCASTDQSDAQRA